MTNRSMRRTGRVADLALLMRSPFLITARGYPCSCGSGVRKSMVKLSKVGGNRGGSRWKYRLVPLFYRHSLGCTGKCGARDFGMPVHECTVGVFLPCPHMQG